MWRYEHAFGMKLLFRCWQSRLRLWTTRLLHSLGRYQLWWTFLIFLQLSLPPPVPLLCTLVWCCFWGGPLLWLGWHFLFVLALKVWKPVISFVPHSKESLWFFLYFPLLLFSIPSWSWDVRNDFRIQGDSVTSMVVLLHSLHRMTRSFSECCIGMPIPHCWANLLKLPTLLTFFPICSRISCLNAWDLSRYHFTSGLNS